MATTFISKLSSATPVGTIVLWYGSKASIPTGWSYYSAAAGYWIMGAAAANTTPQNTDDHDHIYDAQTGLAGGHAGHGFTLSVGAATDTDNVGYTTAGTEIIIGLNVNIIIILTREQIVDLLRISYFSGYR